MFHIQESEALRWEKVSTYMFFRKYIPMTIQREPKETLCESMSVRNKGTKYLKPFEEQENLWRAFLVWKFFLIRTKQDVKYCAGESCD